ncbi:MULTISPECIES: response regulator [Flammeovirga]|uniref:Response regulator n=1 Tax=Flammeovirga agarivorans TaxID=2726742 RepID=A0A7X8SH90_9BACT|nr:MULTISPECIES: response regulator [Flammeovirga]NLR90082.1 response regulator [Flammeovirga agarivorans]
MGKKILVAEDSSVIQNITRKVLQFQNYEIISVKNGQQVLDKLAKSHYDAILLDINMPVMDGMECAQKIRGLDDETKKNVPIVAITGNAKNYSMDDFKAVGINEYLPKPLNFDNLVNVVNKVTNN